MVFRNKKGANSGDHTGSVQGTFYVLIRRKAEAPHFVKGKSADAGNYSTYILPCATSYNLITFPDFSCSTKSGFSLKNRDMSDYLHGIMADITNPEGLTTARPSN